MKGFFVTGTDTGVGKTEIAAYLAKRFSRKGLRVSVMKPVATGFKTVCKDAQILRKFSRSNAPIDCINPVSFRAPLAPLVASALENKKFDTGIIWRRFKRLKKNSDMIIVEGIGGVMVPLYKKGKKVFYVLDMILKMRLPVIIVSRPDLGTINHTLMTIKALETSSVKIKGIIFNQTSRVKKDTSVKTNPEVIERLSGIKVLGSMHYNRRRNKRRVRWLRKAGF
ncbi:MAG: dethiobiotin synthase [Candidatus Omnitrophica bacterium]|nr:dethiobiotin synthase [Candidatus Omnitrophota bacterium]